MKQLKPALIAGALLALGAPALAQDKAWSQMNGHERWADIVRYIHKHHLDCPPPPMSVEEQEQSLAMHPRSEVIAFIFYTCKKDSTEIASHGP